MTHDEAKRAIYIDFECLLTKPHPTPKLLGVLEADGDRLEQLILDPRLAPARVASTRIRVTDTQSAIEVLAERAERENRTIAGWSFFDREVAKRAAPSLARLIDQRYRNVLPTGRKWRQKIHASFAIVTEDAYSPKHTLDKYARLAAYPAARALAKATPAGWIRHMAKQLKSQDGKYRTTTKQAKRDWHRLLGYNRHDCLALRHIALKATRELDAWHAYERTRYCVDDEKRRVCFLAGSASARVRALLDRHGATRFAFITAWNPGSVVLPPAENARREAQLRADVRRYVTLNGEGVGEDPKWDPEESLMVLGISRGKAVSLARKYGQLAIVFGQRDTAPALVSCAITPRN
jgi:hypothetical protein